SACTSASSTGPRPGAHAAKSFCMAPCSATTCGRWRTMRQVKGEEVRRELLPGQSPDLLRELHLVGRDGALHADSLRKLKQVNHLVQLLEPALLDMRERHPEGVLVDAGAGNAYLAFVLYELFLRDAGSRDV